MDRVRTLLLTMTKLQAQLSNIQKSVNTESTQTINH